MNEPIPLDNLFPHLHPLAPIGGEFPFLARLSTQHRKDHQKYLLKYLNEDKIDKAINFLRDHIGKKGIITCAKINELIAMFDISDFKIAGKLTPDDGEPNTWIIWMFITAAFILLNRAIETGDIEPFIENINACLQNAHDYKMAALPREKQTGGAVLANAKKDAVKKEVFKIILAVTNDPNNEDPSDIGIFNATKRIWGERYPDKIFPASESSFTRYGKANWIEQAMSSI
jgi:hypothetical protein